MADNLLKLKCSFIGDFKVGDNLVSNANALCRLHTYNENGIFNKLIVVQLGSIIEAALDQIVYRAQNHTREGVPNIGEVELKSIRETKVDSFNNIIQAMEKHKILDDLGKSIYSDLHRLREFRNRIHIQFDDKPDGLGRDDAAAFNEENLKWSLSLSNDVIEFLAKRFPRPKELEAFAHEISLPKPRNS